MEASSTVELSSPARMGVSSAKHPKKQSGVSDSPKARSKRQGTKAAKTHPTYSQMVKEAITALKDRKGSSRVAILKYISNHYQLGDNGKRVLSQLRLAIKRGIATGKLTVAKGAGVNGSFRLGAKVETKAKKRTKSSSKHKATSKGSKKSKAVSASPKKPQMKKAKTITNSPKRKLKAASKPKPKVSKPKKTTS
uniref:H15 domain-containing protein n=1 Tax=Elaeophora elaphi TaxID=1147741 RepID=A0A0R3S221_9BILA